VLVLVLEPVLVPLPAPPPVGSPLEAGGSSTGAPNVSLVPGVLATGFVSASSAPPHAASVSRSGAKRNLRRFMRGRKLQRLLRFPKREHEFREEKVDSSSAMKSSFACVFVATTIAIAACSSNEMTAGPAPPATVESPPRDSGAPSSSSSSSSGSPTSDAMVDWDGNIDAEAPGVRFIGRFDFANPNAPKTAWPGARILARFDGTGVKATLTHANGLEGGNTWMNVVVDGAVKTPIEVTGASQQVTLASGLAAGVHVVELQKRTEANVGTLTFEGFTFDAGGKLLPPPPRAARRIEFLTDSTIDGYGVDGDVTTTCANDTAPVEFNDARKGAAFLTAEALSAEHHLLAYSGKGLARNEDGTTTELFGAIYPRTLPESNTSAWTFAAFTPDVVVVSLGGSDFAGGAAPESFQTAFGQLRTDIRAKYGAATKIVFVVWSQLKEYDGVRQAVTAAIDAIIAGDANASRFSLPEAMYPDDETACHYHANAAHHQAMATLLASELKSKMGW
jgi:lysophospholipase L1-like esterase